MKHARGEPAIAKLQSALDADASSSTPVRRALERKVPTRTRWATAVAFVEFLVVSGCAYAASLIYYLLLLNQVPPTGQYLTTSALLGSLHVFICLVDDQYNLLSEKWSRHGIARGAAAAALAFVFFLTITFLFKVTEEYSRGTFLFQLAFVLVGLIITRTIMSQHIERATAEGWFQGQRLVVVSLTNGKGVDEIGARLCARPDKLLAWHKIQLDQQRSELPNPEISYIQSQCRKLRPDAIIVIFNPTHLERITRIVDALFELPVTLHLVPVGMQSFMQRSRIGWSGLIPTLEIGLRPSSLIDRFLKRLLDVVLASLALVVLFPFLVLVALAIKLDSRGPVLFVQTRHGFNNEPIRVLKFRTMLQADNDDEFKQATKNDSRVTRVGRILRRTNVDELPQLLNVLRGEMSLVGPRPHPVALNEQFAKHVRHVPRRHNVKPGITGWAQVNGFRGETDTYEKMQKRIEYDLYYIDNWSFFFDIKILLMTVLSKKAFSNAY